MSVRKAGGCHCGAVRYEVSYTDSKLRQCNCSVCSKKGYLHLIVDKNDFTLLSSEDALSSYRFGTKVANHLFCKICGVQSFYIPRSHPDGYSVNARTLDDVSLESFEIIPFDGQNWDDQVQTIR